MGLRALAALYLLFVLAMVPGLRHLSVEVDLQAMYAAFSGRPEGASRLLIVADPPADALIAELSALPGVQVRAPLANFDGPPEVVHALRGKPATDVVPIALSGATPAQVRALTDAPVVGLPVMDEAHQASARSEQAWLLTVLVFGVGAALVGLLRRPLDAVVVMLSVGTAAVAQAGVLGWAGLAMGGPNLMLVPLTVVLGLADCLHLVRHAEGQSARGALRAVALPCLLTTVTTALAFLALLTSEAAVIRQFGVLAALGMFLALAGGLLLPAVVFERWPTPGARGVGPVWRPRVWHVLPLLLLLWPASWVRPDLQLGADLVDGDASLAAQRAADERLGGVFPLQVRLETDVPDGVRDPRAVDRLLSLQRRLEKDEAVGAVVSFADAIQYIAKRRNKRPEQLLGRRSMDPEVRARRVQQVFRSADEAGAADSAVALFDDDRSAFLIYVRYRDRGARAWSRTIDFLEGFNRAAPEVRLEMSGYVPLAVATLHRIPIETARIVGVSSLSALLVVGLRFRRWRAVLGVVPVLLGTVVAALAAMGVCGMPLNHANLFLLSLAIGLGVDAWLHLQSHGEPARAAVLWTTLVLSAGFLTLQFSHLSSVRNMGLVLLSATWANTLLSLSLHPDVVGHTLIGRGHAVEPEVPVV